MSSVIFRDKRKHKRTAAAKKPRPFFCLFPVIGKKIIRVSVISDFKKHFYIPFLFVTFPRRNGGNAPGLTPIYSRRVGLQGDLIIVVGGEVEKLFYPFFTGFESCAVFHAAMT